MSDMIIRVDRLSKLYQIGVAQVRHDTLRDALVSRLPKWGRQPNNDRVQPTAGASSAHIQPHSDPTIWALRDVSFEVKQGEVVGIIGRNGAGKSTLLKILSRITEPTSGRVEMHGRVGSLLEVGTGFHPELTGRDNVYLNGAILGMKRSEIERKFDEIIDFAEIEQFLDTPVKRYSSGMYVRLAFAVAAHLEPEILLVDEVLAVGDVAFQKKCLGKMGDVAHQGRTVLFVSHNMGAISQLCPMSLLMSGGRLQEYRDSNTIIQTYLVGHSQSDAKIDLYRDAFPATPAAFRRCWITNSNGDRNATIRVGEGFKVWMTIETRQKIDNVEISVRIYNSLGQPIFTSHRSGSTSSLAVLSPGMSTFSVQIPGHLLAPDNYSLHFGLHRPNLDVLDAHDHILNVKIEETGSNMWQYQTHECGNILVTFPWDYDDGSN